MPHILLIFASMSGNTEEMAEAVADGIRGAGGRVTLKAVEDTNPSEMAAYDGLLLGSYTWGDGDLPYEFEDFVDEIEEGLDLKGVPSAVFGSGDTAYPLFCAAVDTLENLLQKYGAQILQPGIKVELSPEEEELEACRQLGANLIRAVSASMKG
ncbi:flavodoxin [Salinithrix halophila]|uniref:Flavodoxin n=1 Tax=Salinithrix halophila TaxID=1485204 RepID=A0ABV8JI33_9BACL